MKNIMRYLGYVARIDFEEDSGVFAGNVLGLSEPISFYGASVDELRGDFVFAIDHYLAACKEAGMTPEKQVAGKVLVRLSPENHAAALIAAKSAGVSLNDWMNDAVARKLTT
jgi:predicted HicB family RNase H-like nuclease